MHGLTAELGAFMNSLMDRVDERTADVIRHNKERLEESGIVERAVGIGDRAPDFALLDIDHTIFRLSEALQRGPAVVLFVRGGWCPFCAITLRAFDAARKAIEREGASLVAISPSSRAHIQATTERDLLRYPVLADPALRVAETYGLVWEPDAELQQIYLKLGHDVPRINATGDWRLPIPAGYVIGTDGFVRAARVDTSLMDRLPPATALAEVKALVQGGSSA